MDMDYEERYQTGNMPWDHGMPDGNLIAWVKRWPIGPCKVLDIGCGTGENSIWMARQGFAATGCDLSKTAVERAQAKAAAAEVKCTFMTADFLEDQLPGLPFGFVFDRGCLHCIDGEADRRRFAQNVADHLTEAGLWLSLIGNADEPEREVGPPQLTAAEVAAAVESRFEILSLEAGHFGSDQDNPPRAWICLMRKRA
ncbi:MAG: class I SAM-dependent methyltransferase [Verrucomicrobia bacterium]|nr:class I SAM-dependent methyltransferase [Verrucomicrobiota bacterium]